MNLAMMMNPDMAAMPEDQFRQMQTMTALYGLGGLMRGQDAGGTLSSLMALNMGRHNRQTEAEKKRKQERERSRLLGSILGGGSGGGGYMPPQQSQAQRMGLDMGRTTPRQRNTVPSPHGALDMGRVNPWAGKEDIQRGIFAGESGGDYGALFGYQNRPGGQFANVDLTNMTVGEALQFSDPSGPYGQYVKGQVGRVATPMGAYQVVGTTLRDAVNNGVVSPDEKFTPEVQDRVGAWILSTQGTGAWEGYRGPQSGGVRTAQAGPITREQVVQVLGSDALSDADKRFVVEEFRNQNKNGMTGKERYMNVDGVLYDVTGDRPVAVTERTSNDSAAQQKVNRIMSAYGVDQRTAVGIADGVLRVSRDPTTERIQITNLATNETWEPSASGQQQAPQEATPPANETEQQNLSFGDAYGDAENAFGLEGMFRRGANWASDFVTGEQVYPETGQTQQDFEVLREDLTQDMQSAYGEKIPSWALQAIRDLTPAAGTFEGQAKAQDKLRALGRRFQQELEAVEGSLSSRGMSGLSPEDRQALQSQRGGLRRVLVKIQNAIQGFQGEGVEIRPEVQDRLKAYE